MSASRIPAPPKPPAPPSDESRSPLRAKTAATRLSLEELEEVESAAKRDGKSLAEWLRATVLREARQRPADPVELILAELSATRSMLLNFFLLTAQAGAEGKQLLPETVLKIRDKADALKLQIARKMLQDFFAPRKGKTGANPDPPDAIFEPVSVGYFAAYWTADSAFAAGAHVFWLVTPPLQNYYLISYLDSTERRSQPAATSKIEWLYKTAPGTETGAGFRGRYGLGNRRQREQNSRRTLAPRRRRRLARSGEKRPAKGRFREAGAVSRNRMCTTETVSGGCSCNRCSNSRRQSFFC